MIQLSRQRLIEKLSDVSYRPFSRPSKRDVWVSRFLPRLRKSTVVIVLGMHRSGTSLLTSLLDQAGVNTGRNHVGPRFDNPKGFWEDRFFCAANIDLLTTCGANRDGFDDFDALESVRLNCADRVRRKNLSAVHVYCSFNFRSPVWGWKDPRTCITFPYWQRAFDELGVKDIRLVIAFRSPNEVARSLITRGNDEYFQRAGDRKFEQAVNSWLTYNEFCLAYSELFPSFFVDHRSLLDPQSLKGTMIACADFLDLPRNSESDPASIFDSQLVNQHSSEKTGNEAADNLYELLQKKAGEDCRVYSTPIR